ncbi:MAG TPA: AAA-like domain-containing protein [Chthonomonadaceae bacterium]|nr:AAA-like domain-containing protein [Chthonomonadaceae bacterium]
MPETGPLLTIRLFGRFAATLAGEPLPGLRLREGERLLAYLALHAGALISYRTLAEQFWPSEARQNDEYSGGDYPSVRQAVRALRMALGEEAWRLKSGGKGVVSFDVTDAEVDVAAFERLVQGDDTEGWRAAAALCGGPLLEGWHEGWVREARERCRRSLERISRHLPALKPPAEAGPAVGGKPAVAGSKAAWDEALATLPAGILLKSVGGAVPLHSPFYIERTTDGEFKAAIAQHESIVLVKGGRHTGKTSLLARGLHEARQAGSRVALTDFQALTASHLTSAESLYRALAEDLADQLDLETLPDAVWSARRSANRNLERYLHDFVLSADGPPVVWGLDEVDRLFRYGFSSEVFGLFRSWHNLRAFDPDGLWNRLTLAMAYATEVRLFIADLNQSPFNVGARLTLEDFTSDQVDDLNRRHGEPLRSEAERERFYNLLSGHPYLTRKGLAEMTARGLDMATLAAQADRDEGPFGDHLRRLLASLTQDAELTEVVRGLLRGERCREESFYRLQSAGLLSGSPMAQGPWRCQVYETYLRHHLL